MAITTLDVSSAWAPDINAFNPEEVVPEALILQHSTVAGVIEGDRPSLNVAFINDDDAQFTAENATIDESTPDLDEVEVYTAKITQLVRLTNEQQRQEGTEKRLATSANRAVVKKANEAFLTQAAPPSGKTTPPAGLINIPGIVTGEAVTTNLDPLIDLVAQLESNKGTPSGLIVGPKVWAALRKLKTATGHETALLGAGTHDAQKLLLDLPVTVSNALAADTGLIVDKTAIASAVGPVRVDTSEHAYFNSDGYGIRVIWRIGWNLVHPDRIGKFTMTTDTP